MKKFKDERRDESFGSDVNNCICKSNTKKVKSVATNGYSTVNNNIDQLQVDLSIWLLFLTISVQADEVR